MGIWVAGHFSGDLKGLGQISDSSLSRGVSTFLYYLVPNLSNFDIRGEVVHGVGIPHTFFLFSVCYGLIYSAAVILIATLIFRKRDF